ncbi:MAG: protein kinase [Candidatus Melainabacteria bacterium]|nr:protein kinase [Candidatus Melainabacteria bacterium]
MTEKPSTNQEKDEKSEDENPLGSGVGGTGSSTWLEETTTPVVLEPGTIVLDKYRVVELVGLGGMGSVFRVTHVHFGTVFALKCLNKEQPNDQTWRRFQNEAKAAHILDHPNLIKVHDFGLLPGRRPYFVMDFVDGTTVADEVQRLGRLPVKRCLRIFIQVAFAIAYAHENGVIHRDLKSSNIMVVKGKAGEDEEEIVKIVDFGIAKLTGVDEFNQQTLTKTGEIFGSPLYMSPEQCMGLAVDLRSDLYSLGCMLYEALTGAPPFFGESALATMMKHQSEPPLSLKQASMGIDFPKELERIVAKLLEKDPNNRYQNASLLAADLIQLESQLKNDNAASGTVAAGERGSGKSAYVEKTSAIFAGNPIGQSIIGAVAFLAGMGVSYFLLHNELEAERVRKRPILIQSQPRIAAPAIEEKQFSHFDPATRERVFKFPKNAIGTFIFSGHRDVNCVDEKRVKDGVLIGFNPTYEALNKNPFLLKNFAPNDLTLLYLSKNEAAVSRVFSSLPHLTGLKALNVRFSDFSDADLKYLDPLSNLSYLDVTATNVTGDGLARMKYLNKLTSLHASSVQNIETLLERVGEIPRLYLLSLHADSLDDDSLKEISRCQNMKVLSLGMNHKITGKGMQYLANLKHLRYLDLSGTNVTVQSLEALRQLPNLKNIVIPVALTSPHAVATIRKALPKVKLSVSSPETLAPADCLDFDWKGEGL